MQVYSLKEIETRLNDNDFPFTGTTELGTASFNFREPSFYAGTAIHAGHRIREELHSALEVSEEDRYREEDPRTDEFLRDFPLQIVAHDSRFEYDINRSSERAIYKTPDMSWGLKVWNRELTADEVQFSLKKHAEFHQLMDIVSNYLIQQNGFGIIFDLHSFNYQREARHPWFENEKPTINIGTEAANRPKFGHIIDDFIGRLNKLVIDSHQIRVGENEIFKGGYMAQRLCKENYDQLLVLAVEFKKIFMNEWTGEFYEPVFGELLDKFSVVVEEVVANLK